MDDKPNIIMQDEALEMLEDSLDEVSGAVEELEEDLEVLEIEEGEAT